MLIVNHGVVSATLNFNPTLYVICCKIYEGYGFIVLRKVTKVEKVGRLRVQKMGMMMGNMGRRCPWHGGGSWGSFWDRHGTYMHYAQASLISGSPKITENKLISGPFQSYFRDMGKYGKYGK
jgi:hypothetical protein